MTQSTNRTTAHNNVLIQRKIGRWGKTTNEGPYGR
jgi:hypothetical protein